MKLRCDPLFQNFLCLSFNIQSHLSFTKCWSDITPSVSSYQKWNFLAGMLCNTFLSYVWSDFKPQYTRPYSTAYDNQTSITVELAESNYNFGRFCWLANQNCAVEWIFCASGHWDSHVVSYFHTSIKLENNLQIWANFENAWNNYFITFRTKKRWS